MAIPDPILGNYLPKGNTNKKLPGKRGVFTSHNLALYTYVWNTPVKLIDPDGLAPGDPFDRPEDAAIDFGKTYNDDSIRNNREYGSIIYSYKDFNNKTKFSYNVPHRGPKAIDRKSGLKGTINPKIPADAEFVAHIHSHGAYNPQVDLSGAIDYRTGKSRDGQTIIMSLLQLTEQEWLKMAVIM